MMKVLMPGVPGDFFLRFVNVLSIAVIVFVIKGAQVRSLNEASFFFVTIDQPNETNAWSFVFH
jgi:hypothetical protein